MVQFVINSTLGKKYHEPRVFDGQDARYAAMVAGLGAEARRKRLADIAAGITHSAIPQEERHHLTITMHHGHLEGAKCATISKVSADHALCPRCLMHGHRVEETAIHKYHECPVVADEVWKPLARTWRETTGETVNTTSPLLTIAGLRLEPPDLDSATRTKWRALEPAWRLLHATALLQSHRARGSVHAACHAQPRRDMPKRAAPKAILSAIRHRFQQRLSHEHMRATHAASTCHDARAQFHRHWIATGVATTRAHGPRANLFSRPPPTPPPAPGVHIQVAAAYLPATRVRPPTTGWALQAFRVAADEARTHTLHLRAWGAAPARSTHGLVHHDVPPKHTLQAAQHAAAAAALEYARQLSTQNISTTITLASVTTLRDLQDPHDPAAQPVQRPAGAAHGKRRRLHDSPPQIAGRRRPHAKLVARNRAVLAHLQATCSTRAFRTVPPQELTDAAHKAARLIDTDAHIQTASRSYTRAFWYQSRVWDPDD